MQLVLQIPDSLPDALHLSPASFAAEAKMALAVKLFETGRLSSGQAAELCGLSRPAFLLSLPQWEVAQMQYPADELAGDFSNPLTH